MKEDHPLPPATPLRLAPRNPSFTSRWDSSSRMKSKKGKVAAGCESLGHQCGTCAGRAGSWDADLMGLFRPVAPRLEGWLFFVEAVSLMAVGVLFLLDTTRWAVVGRLSRATLLARCQETRSAPCLCASKFHCLP